MSHAIRGLAATSAGEGYTVSVSLREFIADTRSSVRLMSKLALKSNQISDGFSFCDMGFLERAVVRGTREFRLREFNALFHEVRVYGDEFHAKLEAATPVLLAFGKKVPGIQVDIDDVQPDANTSTANHDWTDNMINALEKLMDYLQGIDQMRSECWQALEEIQFAGGNK